MRGPSSRRGLCWPSAIRQFFTDIREFPLRPNYIIYDGGRYTSSGIAVSFCTNVYGHYLLAELLQPLLAAALDARVIWVGSSEGEGRYFSSSDIEGRKSINPYGSNKFCLQIVSKWLNDRYQTLKLPIRSVVTTPGIVPSNLAASLIPPFLVPLLVPLFWLRQLRLIWNLQELTITGETSAEAVVYVATVPIEQLEVGFRVDSICSRLGVPAIRLTAIPELSAASVLATQRHLNDLNASPSARYPSKLPIGSASTLVD
ncbi:hypothetical protein L0F63_004926 [Massospora cicadina]|nr:hypothetical protein L0F63_004926 [Massospora cicadina]